MSIYKSINSGGSKKWVEFASKVSYDEANSELTINGESYNIGANLHGISGDVAYPTPNGVVKQMIFRSDIYVCEDDEDVLKSLTANLSLKDVFLNWQRGGRSSGGAGLPDKVLGYNEYTESRCTLTESLNYPAHGHEHTPNTYTELISSTPASGWSVYQWWWRNPADTTITSRVQTAQCTEYYEDIQGVGAGYWVYNESIQSILLPMNVDDFSFYASPAKYTDYDLEVELASFDSDNDYIGLVAALNEDDSGVPHLLNLLRVGGVNDKGLTAWINRSSIDPGSPGRDNTDSSTGDNSYYTWYAEVDSIGWPNYTNHVRCVKGHVVSDDLSSETVNKISPGWRGRGKTRIKLQRRGNTLNAWTTRFYKDGDPIPGYEAQLTINLATVTTNNNISYNCFSAENGGGKIGFITHSLPMTYYKILNFKVPKTIIKIHTNEKIVYDIGGHETATSGKFTDEVGIGRMVKNPATNKTFFVGTDTFTKIAIADGADGDGDGGSTIEPGSQLDMVDTIRNKTPTEVKYIGPLSDSEHTVCTYTIPTAGWYKFITSYNDKDGDMWNSNYLWSAILIGTSDTINSSSKVIASAQGSYWMYSVYLPAGLTVSLAAFRSASDSSTSSGRRSILKYS